MKGKALFTEEQMRYLNTLPAVKKVTPSRIMYSQSFKLECLARNGQGESPTRIFRSAGLPPSLVGAKRIERSFARWRDDHHLAEMLATTNPQSSRDLRGARDSRDDSREDPRGGRVAVKRKDLRDIVIREQARYIVKLEDQVVRLQSMIPMQA